MRTIQSIVMAASLGLSGLPGALAQATHPPEQTMASAALEAPRDAACQDLIEGCGVIQIGDHSISISGSQLSKNPDGSLEIRAMASWRNSNSIETNTAPLTIVIPRAISPVFASPSSGEPRSTTNSLESACRGDSKLPQGRPFSLEQLAEVLMGQQAISEQASLFLKTCQR